MLHKRPERSTTPPVKRTEQRYFGNPLNINELWSSENQLRFANTQFLGIKATQSRYASMHCILDTQEK